jgi:hypothetical protein
MSFTKLINEAEKYKLSKEMSGQWATLQLKLSSFSPEYLNVGVIFISEEGEFVSKFLDDYTGLKALMPNQFDDRQFDFLKEITLNSFEGVRSMKDIVLPSSSLKLSNPSFFSGNNAQTITDWLYDESITLAQCKKIRRNNLFNTKSDVDVYKGLVAELKKKDGLRTNSYIQEGIFQKQDDNGVVHSMKIPFMTGSKVATIANTWVKSWESIKLKIFESQTDLSAVSKLSKRNGTLFIQRPDSFKGINTSDLEIIEQNIDELIWKIEKSGYKVESEIGINDLSDKIIDWSKVA